MSQRLKDHWAELKALVKAKPKERRHILKQPGDELTKCLCECALNTLNSNVTLTAAQFKKLSRHKRILRLLADKKVSLKSKKKKILKQAGGFLVPLLVPILTTVLELLVK